MKLLIITQKVDRNDPILSFFHGWLQALAPRFEKLTVICLGKGEYDLPENVKVLSLGKEIKPSNIRYIVYFYKYIWSERRNYDAVFVHMNQEYVLLGAKHWFFMRKPVYLWRNHVKGGLLTRFACFLSRKVFHTSSSAYVARLSNAVQMPVGVDTDFFHPDSSVPRTPKSILFLGRISPIKKVLEFVDWLGTQEFDHATIAGSAPERDREYEKKVRERVSVLGLSSKVSFVGDVDQFGARKLYQSHEVYVNKTPAGSFDKTIIEAAACGARLVVDNADAEHLNVSEHSLRRLVDKLESEIT